MCYSVKTSIISYTIAMIAAIFALCTRQITIGLLILFYCQIQLGELMIWHGIDTNNNDLNKTGTSYLKYFLASHNIAIGLGILLSIIYISKQKIKTTDYIPLMFGIIFFIYVIVFEYLPSKSPDITLPKDPTCLDQTDRCQNNNNRLEWKFPNQWYLIGFVFSLIFFYAYLKPVNTKILLSASLIMTFLLSCLLTPKSVGTIWCFSSAIIAPIFVLFNYFIIKNMKSENILS